MLDLETEEQTRVGSALAERAEAKTDGSKPGKWHKGHLTELTLKQGKRRTGVTLFLSLEE